MVNNITIEQMFAITYSKYLQKDKHYVIITEVEEYLVVADDSGDLGTYEKEYFEGDFNG